MEVLVAIGKISYRVFRPVSRRWRHVDESALSDEESELIANLRRVFEGDRGV